MKRNGTFFFKASTILALVTTGLLLAQEPAIHLSQAEAMKAAVTRPAPDYPAMAKQLHVEGEVQVQAHISESGIVEEAKPLTGNALLATAAVNAMRRWKFSPIMSDGKPRKAIAEVSFNFKL